MLIVQIRPLTATSSTALQMAHLLELTSQLVTFVVLKHFARRFWIQELTRKTLQVSIPRCPHPVV